MSRPEPLSEADRKLLDHLDQQVEHAEDPEDYEAILDEFSGRFEALLREFRTFQGDVEGRLQALEDGNTGATPSDGPVIQQLSTIPEDDRDDVLATSKRIALVLHENWEDISWRLGDYEQRRFGVDTKTRANAKYNPSRLRYELKRELDRDLQSTEIYRGMKRLATLSGGEERVDASTSRVHISGGLYQFREMVTADGADTKRVLWRDEE